MLSVHPTNGFVKEGETLKFQCGPKKTKGVSWYKNGQYFSSTQTNVYQTLATSETGGSYHCEVYFPPQKSEPVEVVITDKNVAFHVVPISPLEGETLKLSCRFKFNIPLKKDFVFYRNGKEIHSMKLTNRESSHSIKVNSTDGSGWYKCTIGMFESRSVKVQVQVRERFAKPVLRVELAAEVFEGLRVTLTCIAQAARRSIRLHYTFYRDGSALETAPDAGGVYTINAAAANVSGNYACEAIDTNYGLRKRSDNIHLSVKRELSVIIAESPAQIKGLSAH
ncbi:high affinity immunoglobulin gamma Fc receptor I-like [Stegostoma tigrinum]|uniref:high affinity immunoglobulin gamma Fc receptor I-like n=1 Tax=Stegostoma tigrinum TaxID=3053191 RepID=UPI002870AF8B|nr:high affinity immunoglobulin gamma Fc receptor I-like [Stegostoma tigrinum]